MKLIFLTEGWDNVEITCPWSGFAPATIKFCERELCGWITQPANTWTNIGFILVGFWIIRRAKEWRTPALVWLGHSAWVMGLGSALFHASGTFLFEAWDLLGMFFISGLMLTYNLKRLKPEVSWRVLLWFFVLLSAGSFAGLLLWRPSGISIFALQLTAAITLEVLLHLKDQPVDYRYGAGILVAFGLALAVWIGDISGHLCDPDNHLLSGHGVWHLLNAVALAFIALFYRQFAALRVTGTEAREGRE